MLVYDKRRISLNHSIEIATVPLTNTTKVFIDTMKQSFLKRTVELLRIVSVMLPSNIYMHKMGN